MAAATQSICLFISAGLSIDNSGDQRCERNPGKLVPIKKSKSSQFRFPARVKPGKRQSQNWREEEPLPLFVSHLDKNLVRRHFRYHAAGCPYRSGTIHVHRKHVLHVKHQPLQADELQEWYQAKLGSWRNPLDCRRTRASPFRRQRR